MKPFYTLIVEDDQEYREKLITLMKRSAQEFAGVDVELAFNTAGSQEEAETSVAHAPEYGFDLIMLDLSYPKDSKDSGEDFYGLNWLPDLRRAQPDAAVVVMTAYGYEKFLLRTVRALRDGRADEFIPKNTPWSEMRQRIREALNCASERRDTRLAARLAARPMRSQVARPAAEDILSAAQRTRNHLLEMCEVLESKDESRRDHVPGVIRTELEALDQRLTSVAAKLAGPQEEDTRPVNCGMLARDLGGIFQLQLRGSDGVIDTLLENDDLTALTYDDDLTVALKEVLQNAVFAALQGTCIPPRVQTQVQRLADHINITVTDSGTGFPDVAIDHMFEQGNSHWPNGKFTHHAGMGLHIARRMMFSIGGDMVAENCDGHARVRLLIRDWNRP